MRDTPRLIAATVAVLTVTVLAGCSSSSNGAAPASQTTTPSTPSSTTTSPTTNDSTAAPTGTAEPTTGAPNSTGLCRVVDGTADKTCTPGAFNPAVSQNTIAATICVSGWTATVRPPVSYTYALKNQQKVTYGQQNIPDSQLEEDHLVPLELGGDPHDPHNLWPDPRVGTRSAAVKDHEENALRSAVCTGTMTLDQARQHILTDWTH